MSPEDCEERIALMIDGGLTEEEAREQLARELFQEVPTETYDDKVRAAVIRRLKERSEIR
jgi:glucose-6-phosphate-specific signal transduction histidine kinase